MRMSSVVPTSLAKLLLEYSPVETPILVSSLIFLNSHSCPAPVRVVGRVRHVGVCVNLGKPSAYIGLGNDNDILRDGLAQHPCPPILVSEADPFPIPTCLLLLLWHLRILQPFISNQVISHKLTDFQDLVDSVDLIAGRADSGLHLQPGHVEINMIERFLSQLKIIFSDIHLYASKRTWKLGVRLNFVRFLLYPETKRLNETEQPVNMDIRSKEGRNIFPIFVEDIKYW